MCSRFTISTSPEALIEEFEATLVDPPIAPSWNVAPTDEAPVVIESREGERRLMHARFGFIPHWAKSAREGVKMLNARVETVGEKPAFARAFSKFRCVVAADGFYEWLREGKAKLPHRFHLPDGAPFGMAALWSVWDSPEGEKVRSFTILTREAVGAVRTIHDRMPIVLPRESYGAWLAREEFPRDVLEAMLEAHRGEELVGDRVSTAVNDVRNDDPSLIEPVSA
ncbi:MAG: SOS response-associated peptidase [Sandaracinaceae bacterium]